MSLDYDILKIEHSNELCWVENEGGYKSMNPITQTLIFKTMSVGMGEITQKNWREFYERIRFVQRLDGVRHQADQDDDWRIVLTPTDVFQHIGLTTNVFPKERQAAWLKRMFVHEQREARWEYADMEKVR